MERELREAADQQLIDILGEDIGFLEVWSDAARQAAIAARRARAKGGAGYGGILRSETRQAMTDAYHKARGETDTQGAEERRLGGKLAKRMGGSADKIGYATRAGLTDANFHTDEGRLYLQTRSRSQERLTPRDKRQAARMGSTISKKSGWVGDAVMRAGEHAISQATPGPRAQKWSSAIKKVRAKSASDTVKALKAQRAAGY